MGGKLIRVDDYRLAGEKLVKDVGDLNVIVYDVPAFQRIFSLKNYPASYLDKCVSVTVAISGSTGEGIDWALIAPYRLDTSGSNKEKVYDIDPMIIALDNGSNKTGEVGYIGYHQQFEGRTRWEPGYSGLALSDAVTALRLQVTPGSVPLSAAPAPIQNALTHMAQSIKTEGLPAPPRQDFFPKQLRAKPALFLGVVLGAYLIFESFIPLRTAVQIGADEGFELAKATLCLHGQHLYTDVWNDQPPLHTFLVTQVLKYVSPSILGPRLLTIGFALLLLIAVFTIVHRVSGLAVAALTTGFVIASPGFLELSSSCMLEIPSLATALAAVCFLFIAQERKWCFREVLAGALFGLALQIKPVPAIYLSLILLIVFLREKQNGKTIKPMVVPLTAFASSLLIVYVGTDLLIDHGAYFIRFHQSWASHFAPPKSAEYGSAQDFPFQWQVLVKNWDVAAPALVGLAVLLYRVRGIPRSLLPLGWLALVFAVFAVHRPWWPYYYIHTAIPLCWCAAIGIVFLYQRSRDKSLVLTTLSVLSLCAFCWTGARIYLQVTNLRGSPKIFSSPVISQMNRFKPFTEYLYADKPVYSFHCNIPVVPSLAIFSLKRIWSGEMTNVGMVEEMEKYKPGLIVLRNDGRDVPFNALLQAQYVPVYMDKDNRLYALRAIAHKINRR